MVSVVLHILVVLERYHNWYTRRALYETVEQICTSETFKTAFIFAEWGIHFSRVISPFSISRFRAVSILDYSRFRKEIYSISFSFSIRRFPDEISYPCFLGIFQIERAEINHSEKSILGNGLTVSDVQICSPHRWIHHLIRYTTSCLWDFRFLLYTCRHRS